MDDLLPKNDFGNPSNPRSLGSPRRVEVVGLKEGHTGNTEREHGHLSREMAAGGHLKVVK